jgi:hypothetical protein
MMIIDSQLKRTKRADRGSDNEIQSFKKSLMRKSGREMKDKNNYGSNKI